MRLIERMESDVTARAEAILSEAKKSAAEIESQAQAEIERLEKAARLATLKQIDLEKARRSAKILQEIKREEAELKRGLVEAAFDAARKDLDELSDSEYGPLFERLAEEALSDLDRKVTISVRGGDRQRTEAAIKSAGVEAEIEEDLDGLGGGLIARSDDGVVFIDNTLHTRLDRSRTEGVTAAGQILFGAGGGSEKPAKKAAKKKPAKKKKKKKD